MCVCWPIDPSEGPPLVLDSSPPSLLGKSDRTDVISLRLAVGGRSGRDSGRRSYLALCRAHCICVSGRQAGLGVISGLALCISLASQRGP